MGLLILLLLAYCSAAPDRFTLAATRGAFGAGRAALRVPRPAQAVKRTRPVVASPAPPKKAAPKLERRQPGYLELAAAGWKSGAAAARERRAAGTDLYGRTTRAVGWSQRTIRRIAARPAARREAPAVVGRVATEAEATTSAAPSEDLPEASTTKPIEPKGTTMTIATTDLDGLSQLEAEAAEARQMAANVAEAAETLAAWAANVTDRVQGARWGTLPIDDAAGNIADAAPAIATEAVIAALDKLDAAIADAHNLADVASAAGARGDVAAFAS